MVMRSLCEMDDGKHKRNDRSGQQGLQDLVLVCGWTVFGMMAAGPIAVTWLLGFGGRGTGIAHIPSLDACLVHFRATWLF